MDQRGLRNSGIPVGGLGTGSIELRSDGYSHEWQFMNNAPWDAGHEIWPRLDTFFFALQVTSARVDRSVIPTPAAGHNSWLDDPSDVLWVAHPSTNAARTPSCQGTAVYDTAVPSGVTLNRRSFVLNRVVFRGVRVTRLDVSSGAGRNSAGVEQDAETLPVTRTRPFLLKPGTPLRVRLRGPA